MKIKQKKQLNLPQLIEYVWENDMIDLSFRGNDKKGRTASVSIDENGEFTSDWRISKDQIFTIEVEEEITEDTKIPKLMTTFKKTTLEGGIGYQRVRIDENYPIKLMLNRTESHGEPVEALHIVNDDSTHTLLWYDGKMVE